MSNKIRTRFAPAPTGEMHLGNIRTALFNYLFAKKHNGTMVLRIEDTDPQRNFDPNGEKIIAELKWLGIEYDEGPGREGKFPPYIQSERTNLYIKKIQELIEKGFVYRCFCTKDELDKKRQRQLALKQPPRYDRSCLKLSQEEIDTKLESGTPFIWRAKLDHSISMTIEDLTRGETTYELKNFTDFPITRQDGSPTFMFANCVDDINMEISHVFRGEDHLTNTVGQAFLYKIFGTELPVFWHMPIMCNQEGKKLSKRDACFTLKELRQEGFLPEAILNYLGIIGGSFEKEILTMDELIQSEHIGSATSTSQIKYDVNKLKWVNHKWLSDYDSDKILSLFHSKLEKEFPSIKDVKTENLIKLIDLVKVELSTLEELPNKIEFYFKEPNVDKQKLSENFPESSIEKMYELITNNFGNIENPELFVENIKKEAKNNGISLGKIFQFIRLILTGDKQGIGILDLLNLLGTKEYRKRLKAIIL